MTNNMNSFQVHDPMITLPLLTSLSILEKFNKVFKRILMIGNIHILRLGRFDLGSLSPLDVFVPLFPLIWMCFRGLIERVSELRGRSSKSGDGSVEKERHGI
jgi:hypothetical protein